LRQGWRCRCFGTSRIRACTSARPPKWSAESRRSVRKPGVVGAGADTTAGSTALIDLITAANGVPR
jgi:hypothetical protein